jgi:glycosyltransferase involved in cell wall biosynthesis
MIGLRGVPATYGGVERAVEELGAELVAAGHDVTVFCRSGYNPTGAETHRGMRLRQLWSPDTRGLEALFHSGRATLQCLADRHDVVHFHAMGPGLFTPLPRYLSRSAVVQTIHGLDNERAKWSPAAQHLLGAGAWLSARVPDRTIVVSEALAEHYRTRWGRDTTVVVNGVRPAQPTEGRDLLRELGLADGRYLLWVGRVVPEKRPDLLVDAFRKLDTDCKVVLVGGSSHSDGYTRQLAAAAGHDDRVVLAGFRYGEQLRQLFSHADGFIMPSDLEGLPLTLLEAVSYRLPVVASDIAPHWEILGAPGPGRRSFVPGSAESLASALAPVLADPSVERQAAEAWSSDVLHRFDWSDVAQQTLAVYEEALRSRARARHRG